jgi:Uncharacterized protein conserved in bacteria (DUF2225)/HEAT repeats
MRARLVYPGVLLVLLLAPVARATTLTPVEVTCPVCERAFTAYRIGSTNSAGGTDRDLCEHAAGNQPLSYNVWTCPHCWYSDWLGEFEAGVPEELRRRVIEELGPAIPLAGVRTQSHIPGWVKYDLAGRVLQWENASAARLARHYVRAAWVVRVESPQKLTAVMADPAFRERWQRMHQKARVATENTLVEGFAAFRPIEQEVRAARGLLAEAMEEGEDEVCARVQMLQAAFALRFRGENLPAIPVFERLSTDEVLPLAARQTARTLLSGIRAEQGFQKLAVEYIEKAVARSEFEGADRGVYAYIAGECCRRRGDVEAAAKWYADALKASEAPAWMTEVAADALEALGDDYVPDAAEIARLRKERLDKALRMLLDPESARDAQRQLRALRDPACVPAVIAALGNESAEVRAYAALTLRFLPEHAADAVAPLSRLLLEDPEEDVRWRAAVALEAIADPRSRAALEKALPDAKDQLLNTLLDALAITGGGKTVPPLLACLKRAPREAMRTLSVLTCREVTSRQMVEDWWEEHSAESRTAWVIAGLKAVGIEMSDLTSADSIPALIGALEDERFYIRANAARALKDLTGKRFGWDAYVSIYDSPQLEGERRTALAEWHRWRSKHK